LPTSHSEVSREATGGRSRTDRGSRKTEIASLRGHRTRRASPASPRTSTRPDVSHLADRWRATCGGSRAPQAEPLVRVPHVAAAYAAGQPPERVRLQPIGWSHSGHPHLTLLCHPSHNSRTLRSVPTLPA
jgi:hypothetical protein